jgi:alkanesulfonate monooxygenase SsuD/methylene tetrahydromethanopterin reductase-like flavin-dependent oxidoreductase (luciferase family)
VTAFGYTLMSEEHGPRELVEIARRAEDAGFDFLVSSDGSIPVGPDPQTYVAAVRSFADAGFERIAFVQVGPDQEGFFRFWRDELQDALTRSTG